MSYLSKNFNIGVPVEHLAKSAVELKLALANEYYLDVDKVLDELYDGYTSIMTIRLEKCLIKELQDFCIKHDLSHKELTSTLIHNFYKQEDN